MDHRKTVHVQGHEGSGGAGEKDNLPFRVHDGHVSDDAVACSR